MRARILEKYSPTHFKSDIGDVKGTSAIERQSNVHSYKRGMFDHCFDSVFISSLRNVVVFVASFCPTIPKIDLAENTDSDEDQVNIDVGPVDPDDNERVYNSESEMTSFLPTNVDKKKEKDIIDENFLDHTVKHNWNVGSEPLNEFSIQYLASMSFPTLFPDGKGDPTNNAIIYNTSDNVTETFALKLKHLIKFGENIDRKWVYRFASHPRFGYWAYNMLYRRRILGQGSFFLKQNPSEANLTLDDLK